jgi:hypothetical protein
MFFSAKITTEWIKGRFEMGYKLTILHVQMIECSCAINHNLHSYRDYWQSADYTTDNNITYSLPPDRLCGRKCVCRLHYDATTPVVRFLGRTVRTFARTRK